LETQETLFKEVVVAMSTIDQTHAPAQTRRPAGSTNGHGDLRQEWEARTRIFLTPIAAPSILGLFGFASSTFMVAAFLAGWFGQNHSTTTVMSDLAPFCLFFGGLAQFMAGMWAYRARDAVATAAHGTWGAFWMGFGVFWILAFCTW
jgi:succinate-acetate transporter protein